jgi:hypothetical protein
MSTSAAHFRTWIVRFRKHFPSFNWDEEGERDLKKPEAYYHMAAPRVERGISGKLPCLNAIVLRPDVHRALCCPSLYILQAGKARLYYTEELSLRQYLESHEGFRLVPDAHSAIYRFAPILRRADDPSQNLSTRCSAI